MGQTHHDGISVYGSGFAIGKTGHESFIGPSGVDGLLRVDKGSFTTSGQLAAVSTRLSSIVMAVANFGGATRCSGQAAINIVCSGHTFDAYLHTGAGTASASSLVNWMAIGK